LEELLTYFKTLSRLYYNQQLLKTSDYRQRSPVDSRATMKEFKR